MVTRQRKPPPHHIPSSAKNNSNNQQEPKTAKVIDNNEYNQKSMALSVFTSIIGLCCIGTASYFGYRGYLETRVNTPFDSHKLTADSRTGDGRYWGSYRPGTYFGMKTRDPQSPVVGMMWYFPNRLSRITDIRHWCELNDRLNKYGWTKHDGRSFGMQEIYDGQFVIETSFIKFPIYNFEDWTARIKVNTNSSQSEKVSFIWYMALDDKAEGSINVNLGQKFEGFTKKLGKFEMDVMTKGNVIEKSYVNTRATGLDSLKEAIARNLQFSNINNENRFKLSNTDDEISPNFVAIQITVKAPAKIDIEYRSVNVTHDSFDEVRSGKAYTEILDKRKQLFDKKFESVFHLQEKSFNKTEIGFAQAAFSNMIGGIGYFYGASKVQSVYTEEPVPYWKAPLYTAVPSRSFFPRGFLWDEGFHGMLISSWDVDIELDIINHWFDLMNAEGWIPREQILGSESLAKVPGEFVVQRNTNANPPTFFLVLKKILDNPTNLMKDPSRLGNLEKLYPRLQTWFNWFNSTQKGSLPGTYRWRGRETSFRELNPKTLTSGLDDFPRSSHPTEDERHVDLRCWIAFAAGVMSQMAKIIGKNGDKYQETHEYLSDNEVMNKLHLSSKTNTYADWGLHTDKVSLKRPPKEPNQMDLPEKIRYVEEIPSLQFVDNSFGYVSLFPFLLKMIDSNSLALETILTNLRDPNMLWTKFGIRSLSKNAPLYMQHNTEHDPPYWRGQIWININYLILGSLHHYANAPGMFQERSRQIYTDLRKNLIDNMFRQYQETGYLWENYNDKTGKGTGCHPFTGWSALVVLIMSEQY